MESLKNLWVIPTDNLTKLGRFIDTNNLFIRTSNDIPRGENINIYITSYEEFEVKGTGTLEYIIDKV